MDSGIKVTRETEFYQGFIRFKMSVSNETPFVITNVNLDFRFDDDLLRIDIYEPSSYQTKNGKIILGNIDSGRSKSIAVLFDPLLCSKGTDLDCFVTYKDAQGKFNSAFMDSKTISVVCPMLKTDSDINIGRLKEFIEKLPSRDSKVYEIHQGFEISKLAGIARKVVEKHDVRHIRTLHTTDGRNCEIWYYGKTKVHKDDIVIRISIVADRCILELFAATKSAEVLTGLLAEIGRDLKHGVEVRASGKGNVINVTIKDSVIQRSNLLDLCDMDGTCPVNLIVEDSLIQHSNIGSRRDGEELKRKEIEEQEKLKRQQEEEEEARLKKAEEERLRRQLEEAARNAEEIKRKIQDELRRQREEAERKQREEERNRKEKEALERKQWEEKERKQREEKERKRREEEEKARREREEQEKRRKQREELERKKLEEAEKAQAPRQTVQNPAQKKVPPKKPGSSSGKGILVFSLIFGVLLIGAAVSFFGLNDDSDDSPQEIQTVSATASSENTEEDTSETTASSAQTSSSQNSDTYTNSIGMEFVKIPAGEFMMGSPSGEKDKCSDEGPVHKVMIEEPYYLGKYEVTQEQWLEVMGSNPSRFEGDNLPVEKVSWDDVQKFIEKLNEMEGTNKYRLQSEAEWEYACRAGTTTRYYFGDDESKLGDYAWYGDNSGWETHPVGQKKPNPWGLYDMYGNVLEWCQDRWHDNYNGAPSDGNAWEDGGSSLRVKRGGGWNDKDRYCRSADRRGFDPGRLSSYEGYAHFEYLGFRVLMDI